MAPRSSDGVGARIRALRALRRMRQRDLAERACVSLPMVKMIEQGTRHPSDHLLGALANALGVTVDRLLGSTMRTDSRVHDSIPALRQAVDAYDLPDDGPVRPIEALRADVSTATAHRLSSNYVQLTADLPELLAELSRALHTAQGQERLEVAGLMAAAYRSADAAAYKYGYHDLSGRLIELMRWASREAGDPLWNAATAYVRTETFFASKQLATGLRALHAAIDAAPPPTGAGAQAAVGALHMRAAVVAGRMKDEDAAGRHLAEAKALLRFVREGSYRGTAAGPASYRIHEVAVAVELGDAAAVLATAAKWKPPAALPAERRSHFYIDVARAQLWANRAEDAHESLQVARRIAPQHVREHGQVREVLASLLRQHRNPSEQLLSMAEWARAV